ncbi:DMT family transporter [Owariibacterium komagatae]|uniref:DMT family transporter n=1 Tax=Owariibacterium komagatae TaxID=3136601 RepID=UPI0038B24F6E
MNRKKWKGNLLLLLTALIWGAAFVAQSAGMEQNGPFTFNTIRMILGGIVLIPCIALFDKMRHVRLGWRSADKNLWVGGCLCGVALFTGATLQQFGIQYTSAGKAGFITALYVIFVPLCRLFAGKRPGKLLWGSVALAAVGMYLLCMDGSLALSKGDVLVLLGAFGFTAHILIIDHFSQKVDGVRMSCIQFFVAGALSLVCMFLFEAPSVPAILSAWAPILYASLLSCGVAYTLQVVAQKDTDPTVASLILCLESVFAVLFGWLLLGETLSMKELLGCILMFVAIVLAQFA